MTAGGTEYRVANVFRHPSYGKPRYANDIALIKVATPIEFSDLVKPIEFNPHAVGGRETLFSSKACKRRVRYRHGSLIDYYFPTSRVGPSLSFG